MDGDVAIKKFADGEVIFRQGSQAEEMYAIRRGQVRVYRERDGHETALATLKQGDFLGEMAMLSHAHRAASAQAVGEVELRVVNDADLRCLASDGVVSDLLQTLIGRLRHMDEALETVSATNSAVREGLAHIRLTRDWYA
jgi:subfamily B ATP-binding cassette protein HlyB/CyaB